MFNTKRFATIADLKSVEEKFVDLQLQFSKSTAIGATQQNLYEVEDKLKELFFMKLNNINQIMMSKAQAKEEFKGLSEKIENIFLKLEILKGEGSVFSKRVGQIEMANS